MSDSLAAFGAAWRSLAGVLLTASAMALAGCGSSVPAMTDPPAPEVFVSRPLAREVTDYFEFPGQTAAINEVEVRARVTGYITKVNFEDGQEVKKDQVLFEIDPRPYKATLDRAEGEVARLKALHEKAKADNARAERLIPSGAISQEEYELAKAQLKVSEASIATAEAAVADARLNWEYTRLTAPFNGRVSRARMKEGNLVHFAPGDSMVLTTVVTTGKVYAYFSIDEHALLKYRELGYRLGKELTPTRLRQLRIPVEVSLANEQGFPHAGYLDFVDNKLDPKTGSIRARGLIEEDLASGLFVRVRVPYGKPHPAMLVSDRAVGTDQKEKFLLVVNKDKKVERRRVTVGSLQDGLRVVTSGIKPDEWVIVKGLQRARAGAIVKPRFEEAVGEPPAAASSTGLAGAPRPAPRGGTKN